MNKEVRTYARTSYDRAKCQVGIVHLGYGAFHRAHQAVFIDDYMDKTNDLSWGIAAVNLRDADTASFTSASRLRDGYLLKTMTHDGTNQYRSVRPHVHFADWAKDKQAAEALLALPTVHVVTITVTESGYYLAENGNFSDKNSLIRDELQGKQAETVYAYLAAGLQRRLDTIGAPISVLCCDNIRNNGGMLRRNLLDYIAKQNNQRLHDWVQRCVAFPCSMVDRITPRQTNSLKQEVAHLFSESSMEPIHAESFIQWVIEDRFAAKFPELDSVGVEIVPDVHPYEEAKIRILNGSHTGLCYLGALAGLSTFDEAMRHPICQQHIEGFADQNILPSLILDLPFDKYAYRQQVYKRFLNVGLSDTLERICMDGYTKFPLFILPTIQACLDHNISPRFGYDAIASWYVYASRFAAGVAVTNYIESNWSDLKPLLHKDHIDTFVRSLKLWGNVPDTYPEFVTDLKLAITRMEDQWPK